jgi:putative inorganic carbon (HCO3(-)) transporter
MSKILGTEYSSWDRKLLFLLYLTLFLIPLHPFSVYFGLVSALIAALGRAFSIKKIDWKAGEVGYPAFGFLFFSLLSIVNSKDWTFSIFNWTFQPFLYALLFVLLFTFVKTEKEKRKAFRWIFAGAAAVMIFGIYQFLNIQDMAQDLTAQSWVDPKRFPLLYRRMFSTLENPNLLAGYLLMILSFSIPFYLYAKRGRRKWGLGLFSLALLLCLALTYCRGAWISLAAMAAILGLFYNKKFWLLFLAAPVILLIYHGQISVRFLSLFSGEDTSVDLRFALWESAMAMFEDHPLLGIGYGSFFLAYPDYNFYIQDPTVLIFHAHNLYINMLAEVGLPGCLCYLTAFFMVLYLNYKKFRRGKTPFEKALALGGILLISSMAVMGLGDHVLFSRSVSFCFWSLAALTLSGGPNDRAGNEKN